MSGKSGKESQSSLSRLQGMTREGYLNVVENQNWWIAT